MRSIDTNTGRQQAGIFAIVLVVIAYNVVNRPSTGARIFWACLGVIELLGLIAVVTSGLRVVDGQVKSRALWKRADVPLDDLVAVELHPASMGRGNELILVSHDGTNRGTRHYFTEAYEQVATMLPDGLGAILRPTVAS